MGAPLDMIRKALDRASESDVIAPTAPEITREAPQRRQPPKHGPDGRTQYDYVATRQIKPDDHVLKGKRIVAPFRKDQRSIAFQVLRAQVLKALRHNGWRSIAVTSSKAGEGKSVIAANLAISMSMEFNQTVLLVDADLRRPVVADLLGVSIEHGLGDYLEKNVPLRDILVNPGMERLVVLPSKGNYANASELLSGPRMQQLAEELKARYSDRVIVYDLPPLLVGDDALVCLPYADSVVLVVGDGQSSKDEVLQSRHLLQDHNILGVVLNKSTDSPPKYAYNT
jgi:capsular exopolysaccharide synthesis family protein